MSTFDKPTVVALVSPAWPLERAASGIVTYVARLRGGLENLGVQCPVLALGGKRDLGGGIFEPHYERGLAQRALDSAFGRTRLQPWWWRRMMSSAVRNGLEELVRTAAPQVLECEETRGLAADYRRVFTRPIVVRLHGPWAIDKEYAGEPNDPEYAARVRMERTGIVAASGVTAPSKDTLERVRRAYELPLANAEVIPNLCDTLPVELRFSPRRARPNTVLFVGRFDRMKGADILVRAFGRLRTLCPEAKLEFVGPDPGLHDDNGRLWSLEDYLSAHLPNREDRAAFHNHGFLTHPEIARLRQTCAVTVVCSRQETFSMTVAEALAAGSPVVATRVGGVPELIAHERNGLLCEPRDPESLANAIARVLGHPDYALTLAEQGLRDCEERYSSRVVASRTLDYYAQLLDTHGSAHR